MRKIVVAVTLASGLGISSFAQTADQPVSISVEADSIQRLISVQEIGIVKDGPANLPLTAKGNVVIVLNGIRITADSAVWDRASRQIELNGGSARIDLPGPATFLRIANRR